MRSCSHGSVPHVTEYRETSFSVVLYRGVVPNWRLPSVEDRLYTAVCLALLYERSFRGPPPLSVTWPHHAFDRISFRSFLFFRAFFLLFSPFFFLLRFWITVLYRNSIKGHVTRIETVEEIGELLSGMEFWELDSWSFLKAYNSSWERSLLARTIFYCFLLESRVHYVFLFSFFRSFFLDLAKLGYNVTGVLVSNSLTTYVLKIDDLHTKIEDNKLKTNSLNAELTD